MGTKTKKIFIVSLVTAFVSIGALSLFSYKIQNQGVRLEEQISILTESNTKESAHVRLSRLVQDTESERALLASSFFKDEGESIVFLGEIETLASALGLSLETEELDKVVDEEKRESIRMTFSYEGAKDTVFTFSKLMEVTPYHSRVESLSLHKLTNENWQGTLTILISINTL